MESRWLDLPKLCSKQEPLAVTRRMSKRDMIRRVGKIAPWYLNFLVRHSEQQCWFVFMHWRRPSDSKSFFCAQGTTSNGVGSHESPQAEEGTSQKEPQYLFVHICGICISLPWFIL